MALMKFILQGLTAQSHDQAIKDLFDLGEIERVVFSIAYVNLAGVEQVEDLLRKSGKKAKVFAGVRNDVTTFQGLERLFDTGVQLIAVDTGTPRIVFHPKLYFVRSKTKARLLIGSANLTSGGMRNNIEAGMSLEFDLTDEVQNAVADDLDAKLEAIPIDYPHNTMGISRKATLEKMLADGRLLDETVMRVPRSTSGSPTASREDTTPRIKLKVAPLRRAARKPAAPPVPGTKSGKPVPKRVVSASTNFDLMWESKPLKRRSLGIASGPNTNPTGSTTLGKGTMKINPVSYFRNNVFGSLPWTKIKNRAGNPAEQVDADFDLIIKGTNVGSFKLTLRHSLTRAKAALDDKNLPTNISWNEAIGLVRREDLLNRTMRLFRAETDQSHFAIEID
jgi:HKD family nuclease